MGTIGGSVANNDPAADYPAAVIGLGATLHTQTRSIAADDYFKDLFDKHGELLDVDRDEPVADVVGEAAVVLQHVPPVLAGRFALKEASDALAQMLLLLAECEVHGVGLLLLGKLDGLVGEDVLLDLARSGADGRVALEDVETIPRPAVGGLRRALPRFDDARADA